MAHVVCAPCFGYRCTECAAVCPVQAFREAEQILYIDPAACIDCEACVGVCPVKAIFFQENVPEKWRSYIEENARQAVNLPMIDQRKKPLREKPA